MNSQEAQSKNVKKRSVSVGQKHPPEDSCEGLIDNSAGGLKHEFRGSDDDLEGIVESLDNSEVHLIAAMASDVSEMPTANLMDALDWYQSIPVLRPHFSSEKKNSDVDITKTKDPAVLAGQLAQSRDHDPFVENIERQARANLYFDFWESESQWIIDKLDEISKGAFIKDPAPSVNLFRSPISDDGLGKLVADFSPSQVQCYFFRLIVHVSAFPDSRAEHLLPDITHSYAVFERESTAAIDTHFFLLLTAEFDYQSVQNTYGVTDLKPDILTIYHWHDTPATIRHWAYYQCACAGVIPKSEIIDSWVVKFMDRNFGQKPKASRSGIFMFTHSPVNKLLGRRKISRVENLKR